MRVSDAEREAAATELREHYAAGRLTLEELNERLDKALAAKTRADLNGLMTDLPSGRASAGSGTSGTAGGPFGPSGPFGPGGPYGSRQPGWGAGNDWRAGSGWGGGPVGRGIGAIVTSFVLVSALLLVGILGAFGIGTGRPIGIVLILAAFALLRRLVFRRRVRGGRGCGRRRGW
ncbi:MAG TPA: DUF1707 domain-containing protein [Trebonia sp.]|nr:DUF1707 domain-containing protein [Trebonia sp.]